jgi:hypothetical protein
MTYKWSISLDRDCTMYLAARRLRSLTSEFSFYFNNYDPVSVSVRLLKVAL